MGFLFLEFAPPAVQVMEDMKNGELNPKADLEKFKLQLVDHPLIKGSGWVNVFLFWWRKSKPDRQSKYPEVAHKPIAKQAN